MKCENCRAYNAHVLVIKDMSGTPGDRYVLCPRCLSILKQLDEEYESIINDEDMQQM